MNNGTFGSSIAIAVSGAAFLWVNSQDAGESVLEQDLRR